MANIFTHTVGITYHTDAGTITTTTDTYTADSEVDHVSSHNAGATADEIDVAITVANVKSMVLYADQAMTLKTNSSSSPAATIDLLAKKQVVWNTDHAEANPLTTNVTKIFAACTNTAILRMSFLVDQTP